MNPNKVWWNILWKFFSVQKIFDKANVLDNSLIKWEPGVFEDNHCYFNDLF
jgi:hypothetical protein